MEITDLRDYANKDQYQSQLKLLSLHELEKECLKIYNSKETKYLSRKDKSDLLLNELERRIWGGN